jgi:hypothetical protein
MSPAKHGVQVTALPLMKVCKFPAPKPGSKPPPPGKECAWCDIIENFDPGYPFVNVPYTRGPWPSDPGLQICCPTKYQAFGNPERCEAEK